MCTVSVVPHGRGVRVACNRDERLERPAALHPGVVALDDRKALLPIDPLSRGTWFGVNDAGLIAVVLNRQSRGETPPASRECSSRGLIVPQVLACGTFAEALERARQIDATAFEPFRLMILQGQALGLVVSHAARLRTSAETLHHPRLLASSSLDEAMVERARRRLFHKLLAAHRSPLIAQEVLHRHHWPDQPEISVQMCRCGARTVSRTVVDVTDRVAVMRYEDLSNVVFGPSGHVSPVTIALKAA